MSEKMPLYAVPDKGDQIGVSQSASREDHKHIFDTYATAALPLVNPATAGTFGEDPSRGDHQHEMPSMYNLYNVYEDAGKPYQSLPPGHNKYEALTWDDAVAGAWAAGWIKAHS